MMQLLEEFGAMEKKRIERTAIVLEKNEKLEKTNLSLGNENRKLSCRVDEQQDTIQKLEKVNVFFVLSFLGHSVFVF